jgi:carbonic anhydrase
MMSLNSNKIIFIPKYISFRFPSEHSFMGNRYSGEIQIHLEELMPDKKRHFVNGLMISIPMEMKSEYHNFSPLEPLGMDFWKQILQNKKTYKPKNFMNKQRNVFSLSEIFNQILISKSKYFLYLGSETVPPCTGTIF